MSEAATPARPHEEVIAVARGEFDSLLRVCANLTSPQPLEELLDSLLSEARRLVGAEAGSLYVVYGDRLRFICSQNDARPYTDRIATPLEERPWAGLCGKTMPLNRRSLAGYVASTGEPLRIADVYEIARTAPFQFDASHDKTTGYRTQAMLAIPLREPGGRVLGVLQVINRLDADGRIMSFSQRDQQILGALGAVAAVSLRHAQLHEELRQSHLDTILRLATAAEFRDGETGDHIRRMSCYCEAVARQMGLSREWARQLLFASPMHDVGKLGVPDAVLNKPGPLSHEERRLMQRHTLIGARILEGADSDLLRMAQRIAHFHHERWDGSGYPEGIAGEAIPQAARIAAIADVFDALTSPRVYKAAFPIEQSSQMIRDGRGSQFDPDVVDAFLAIRDDVASIYEAYHPGGYGEPVSAAPG